ncbi:MAG: hypothetical protein SGILL_005845 [Bacillariaceae sp.]
MIVIRGGRKRPRSRMTVGSSRKLSSGRSLNSEMYGAWFCFQHQCTLRWQSWMYTLLIIVLGAAACITVLVLGMQSAHQSSQKLFFNQAQEVVFSLKSSWREYETVLLWIHESCDLLAEEESNGNATTSSPTSTSLSQQIGFCSRTDFAYLTRHIESLQLPLVSIQFAPNITNAQRPALEAEGLAHQQEHSLEDSIPFPYLGITNVTFDEEMGDLIERIPAPIQDVYFPVHYVHPTTSIYNQAILETDLNSVPSIQQDIAQAFETFEPVMGDRFHLDNDEEGAQWAVGILHPGIDEYEVLEGSATNLTSQELHHHSISRIIVRPVDMIRYCADKVDFPEQGGVSVFIFDETEMEGQQHESTYLAGATVLDDGSVVYIDESQYETMEGLETYSFGHLRTYQDSMFVADHTWSVVVIPTGETYDPSFEYVVVGAFVLFLCTILVTCLLHSSMNRTNQMRAMKSEASREKAKSALLQAQRERHLNDFIAHEVRNPLSSALAALSFVREGAQQISDESARESLSADVATVQNSLDYIDDLLRNMLDIHRTDSEDFTLRYSLTNLKNGLLNPCKDLASSRAGGKGVKFLVDCSSKLWGEVDPIRLEQVLLNLAMDAAKHVGEGGFVRFRADDKNGCIRLYVEDSGSGIPPESRERLFERYTQSLGLIAQGTGVGLHICKTLIDLMGAKIWLDETYDSGVPGCPGTRFVIDLQRTPLQRCEKSPTGFCGRGHCGCGDYTAVTATVPSNDCADESGNLNQEEGIGVCRLIDESGRTVEMTDHAQSPEYPITEEVVDLEAGLVSLATPQLSNVKQGTLPVDDEMKLKLSEQAPPPFVGNEAESIAAPLGGPITEPTASSTSTRKKDDTENDDEEELPEGLSVLFVDDDKTLRKLFCRSARRLSDSWIVEEAHNGETAIQMVKDKTYDLIFMDQYMESTSKQLLGTETVKFMKDSCLVGDNTIICGLSANEEKERFVEAGADFFLLKPIQCAKDALKKEILRVLREANGETKSIQDDISFHGVDREEDTADARKVRYQRRRSSCV